MASAQALRSKIDAVLRRVQATPRPVYFRTVTHSGGNSLLGVGQTDTVAQALVDPQPAVTLLTAHQVAASSGVYTLGDYEMIFSGNTAESDLRTKTLLFGTEVMQIVKMDPIGMGGMTVAWKVVARSAMRAPIPQAEP